MAKNTIDIGTEGNDGTGDSIRESFNKVNQNFTELYAVFGVEGSISFTDLSDTPDTLIGEVGKLPVVNQESNGIEYRSIVSNNALNGSNDTISITYTENGEIALTVEGTNISQDSTPSLSAPFDAGNQPIARVRVSEAAVEEWKQTHSGDITIEDLVIDKRFADATYQQRLTLGGEIRLDDEPATNNHTVSVEGFTTLAGDSGGNLTITAHGLDFTYTGVGWIFTTDGDTPTAIDENGASIAFLNGGTYYSRIRDVDTISLHPTKENAITGDNKIFLSGGTGNVTLTDADHDSSLMGNWLDSVPLPRKSVVRKQGDVMEGVLTLADHPGAISGAGTPAGPDDLQAATKLYVDNMSPDSQINIFVSTSGDDRQQNTPAGSEGRSPAYAYRTINEALKKAEEVIIAAPYEAGPYKQTITYNDGLSNSEVLTQGVNSSISNRGNAKALLTLNRTFLQREVSAFVAATYPNFDYDIERCERDVGLIIDSIGLDIIRGNDANYLSRWAAISYYGTVSGKRAIGEQKNQTLAAMAYLQLLMRDYIVANQVIPSPFQARFTQEINVALTPDASAAGTINDRFVDIFDILNNGVLQMSQIKDGIDNYVINLSNGSLGNVDQADPTNKDIIPGKVIIGKESGAIGRIISYTTATEASGSFDSAELELLEPVEFLSGETLAYGNIVRETQVTLKVESGTYEEDLPLRVPQNVSIVGDEFRRCLVRPKNRISQSRLSQIFFYRDNEFDTLILGASNITELVETEYDTSGNVTRASAVGTYNLTDSDYTTNGFGSEAVFQAVVDGTGEVTVTITDGGQNFRAGDLITLPDSVLGSSGADAIVMTVDTVPNGIEYLNPRTNTVDGYFGRHYLKDPAAPQSTGDGFINPGDWVVQAKALIDNQEFIVEQTENWMLDNYPALVGTYVSSTLKHDIRTMVKSWIHDLQNGGLEMSLEQQGIWGEMISTYSAFTTELQAAIGYTATLIKEIITGAVTATYGASPIYTVDLFYGDTTPTSWVGNNSYQKNAFIQAQDGGNTVYYKAFKTHISSDTFSVEERDTYWTLVNSVEDIIDDFTNLSLHAFSAGYNPPKHNKDIDVFLMNDGTILRNITVQRQGGFMCVLDPEGQILTRSPYIQTGSSFSQSLNKQAFRGGLFVDAFCGNSALEVTDAVSPFRLTVKSLPGQGLFIRRPQTPSPFYIDGRRFQVNSVTNYNADEGTATLILDKNSNPNSESIGQGFTGVTSLIGGVDLDSATEGTPIAITLQTAGNRSMLGNDFTQINDLGYGLVCVNGGISEMVSMFTYYCWASYYSKNGSEIRSLTGSSCYGEYGLVSEGADPNEVPDRIFLAEDLVEPAKTFKADLILEMPTGVSVAAGDTITQDTATGTVVVGTSGQYIYLKDVDGTFNNSEALSGGLGTPVTVDALGFSNAVESLSVYVYDVAGIPASRGEVDVYHPVLDRIDRYLVTNVEKIDTHVVGRFNDVAFSQVPVSGSSAKINIRKTRSAYVPEVVLGGTGYSEEDTFTVLGSNLGGTDILNDCTFKILEVDNGESGGDGVITALETVAGTPFVSSDDAVPVVDGTIYKLNFGTGSQTGNEGSFSKDGLAEVVDFGAYVDYRRNSIFILDDVSSINTLKIRPSTAIIFDEDPKTVYRSISFQKSNSVGNLLTETQTALGIDTVYDYVRLIIDQTKATDAISLSLNAQGVPLSGGTTKGATVDDTTLAIQVTADDNEIYRLNNNTKTPVSHRPAGTNADTYQTPLMFTWKGKKFYAFNYRTVRLDGVLEKEAAPEFWTISGNEYALVDIEEVLDDSGNAVTINAGHTGNGIPETTIVPGDSVTLRCGLQAGANGDVTVNISTTRATGHDFLNVGSGGFNTSNYPNVIFGAPREASQPNEVDERTKGRVFYVSTDQNGIFRVGKFFSVDQGTGAVSFEASIALSNVDGIGFKRGVVVSEFSSDDSMADNASDAVPTESATRGYVDRRLGYDLNGNLVPNPLGPSVLAANGSIPMSDDLNAANNRITNLQNPIADKDVANKYYVDAITGEIDSIRGLKDTTITPTVDAAELISASGYKIIEVDLAFVNNGPFQIGDTITGSLSSATGVIVDVYAKTRDNEDASLDQNHLAIVYTPTSGTFTTGGASGKDIVSVTGGASCIAVEGPHDEWMNTKFNAAADITVSVSRTVTSNDDSLDGNIDESEIIERALTLDLQINPDTIKNSDVKSDAAIAQSKLDLNAATTFATAGDVDTTNLGVAAFDDTEFTATSGFVELQTATDETTGIDPVKFTHVNNDTLLGRAEDPVLDPATGQVISAVPNFGAVATVSFADVADRGGAILHTDFDDADLGVMTRSGTANGYEYDIVAFTDQPTENTIVKRTATGGVRAQELVLGLTDTSVILSTDGTTINFTTPAQGTILSANGAAGSVKINVEGTVDLIGDGTALSDFTSSELKTNSNDFEDARSLAASWMYTNFLEAANERNTASTGISIGAGSGFTSAGEVALVVPNSADDGTIAPLKVDTTSIFPDTTSTDENTGYDIGKTTAVYNRVYAREFIGAISGATEGNVTGDLTGDIFSDPNNSASTSKVLENGVLGDLSTDVTGSWFLGDIKNEAGTTVLDVGNGSEGAILTGQVTDISNFNTANLSEGTSNFYFTDTRWQTAMEGVTLSTSSGTTAGAEYDKAANTLSITFPDIGSNDSTADSSNTTNGALVVAGGIGVGKNLNVGGSLEVGTDSAEVFKVDKNTGLVETKNIVPINGDADSENYNIGTSTNKYNEVNANLFRGTALEAYYADLAENYVADAGYEPGTVLVFGGEKEVAMTDRFNDHRVAGVVSTDPAYLMNSHCEGQFVAAIAMQGRVPCKVLGKVEKGDILVTSATPGYAIVNNDAAAGRIIGKALENKTTNDKGVIEVVVGKH